VKSTTTTVTLLIFLTLPTAKTVVAQVTAAPSPSPESTPAERIIIDTTLRSKILAEDRRIIIHLPRNYSKDVGEKYPVMYVLDGTSQDGPLADKLTVLSDAGLAPSAIVVGLPNTRGNRERDQTPPFMRRNVDDQASPYGVGDKFLAFIEMELIPFIDRSYRASAFRTLSGNSRGGLFVLYALMERPKLFQSWFCYSTPVWRFDNLMVARMAAFLRVGSGLKGFLFVSVGDKETDQMVGGFTKLVEVLGRNQRKQFKWVAYRTPYAIHQDNALISTSKGLGEWGKYFRATN
jgi:predicted alpha/beta superfamily hydrolase